MAIVFDCPHCKYPYKLKEEFAGRKATCKNPDCRQQITIPTPLSAAEAEAAALSALADDAPAPEAAAAASASAPVEKTIAVSCNYCGHNWTVPMSKAGKNMPCPDCRKLTKVPEPKQETPEDWRQKNTKLPSLAKQAHEKLEGVQDAGEAKPVSGEALREADVTGIEYEPRPLKQKVLFVLVPLALLSALGGGVYYLVSRNKTINDDQLWVDAWKDFGDSSKEMAAGEPGLCSVLLHRAEAEYLLRQNTDKKLLEARDLLVGKCLGELNKVPQSATKNAIVAELASAIIALGGTDDEVKSQTRLAWRPQTQATKLGSGQRGHTIHEEIQKPLGQYLRNAEFDFKIELARRLTRELVKKGQAEFAADMLPLAYFNDPEKDEASAVIALEIKRADPGSHLPHQIAEALKARIEAESQKKTPNWKPYPASAQTLCGAVGLEFHPLAMPKPNAPISEATRIAYTGKYLLDNQSDQAVELAKRGIVSDSPAQLRALLLCAEWMPDPTAALDAAVVIVKTKDHPRLPESVICRLTQIGFDSGKAAQAKDLANSLYDEGLKAWARGDGLRLRSLASPKERLDDGWLEVPITPDKLRAGHAWGRLWIERQNAKLSGDRNDEKKVVSGWQPAALRAFGLAGIALGLQDR